MFRNDAIDTAQRTDTVARRAAALPLALSFVLLLAAIVDQQASQTLESYSVAMYSAHGVSGEPGAIYGLLYTVAGLLVVLWSLMGLVAWSGRRWTLSALVAVLAVNVTLSLLMLFVTEYSKPVFPPLWGLLAALPVVAGLLAAWLFWQRRHGRRAVTP